MGIRRAKVEDAVAIGRVLGRAFDDDPIFRFILPDDDDRRRRLPRLFETLFRHHHVHQEDAWTTDDCMGAALWSAPGKWSVGIGALLRIAPGAIGALGTRSIVALRTLHGVELEHPKDPNHHYLSTLGIDPTRQGQGLGAMLIAPVLDKCDRDGVPAYLESSNEKNRPFYRRHGFELLGLYHVPGGGPSVARMWREPRSARDG